jgi:hypothetical protein
MLILIALKIVGLLYSRVGAGAGASGHVSKYSSGVQEQHKNEVTL